MTAGERKCRKPICQRLSVNSRVCLTARGQQDAGKCKEHQEGTTGARIVTEHVRLLQLHVRPRANE